MKSRAEKLLSKVQGAGGYCVWSIELWHVSAPLKGKGQVP